MEDSTCHLILELGEVDYISSSLLQFLIEAQDRTKQKDSITSLVGIGLVVRSVIETAQLDSLFRFHETLEELGIAPPAPPATLSNPVREEAAPPRVEKIQPQAPPERDAQFWRFWGTIAALIAASLAYSLYLYLTR